MNNEIKTHAERKVDNSVWQYCGDAEDIRLYCAEIAELRVRIESLAPDAERYNWLVDNSGAHQGPEVFIDGEYHIGNDLTKEIDAAIAKEKA